MIGTVRQKHKQWMRLKQYARSFKEHKHRIANRPPMISETLPRLSSSSAALRNNSAYMKSAFARSLDGLLRLRNVGLFAK